MPISQHYILDGTKIASLASFYQELASKMVLPDYFSHNLDALWDVLSTDIAGPFSISWTDSDASHSAMGDDFNILIKLLTDLQQARKDFSFSITQTINHEV